MADDKLIESIVGKNADRGIFIDKKYIATPDMGELDRDMVTQDFLKKLHDGLNDKDNNWLKAAFYKEEPCTTDLGYNEKLSIFCIKGKPTYKTCDSRVGQQILDQNKNDGDTVYFDLESIEDNNKPFVVSGTSYPNFKSFVKLTSNTSAATEFGLRFVGINAPEIEHRGFVSKIGNPKIYKIALSDIVAKSDYNEYVFRRSEHLRREHGVLVPIDNNKTIDMIKTDKGTYHEITNMNATMYTEIKHKNAPTEVKALPAIEIIKLDSTLDKKTYDKGKAAKESVISLLNSAEDMRVIVDAKAINKQKPQVDNAYKDGLLSHIYSYILNSWQKDYQYQFVTLGFNAVGHELNDRLLGTIYLKVKAPGMDKAEWINLSKYVIAMNDAEVLKDYSNNPAYQHNYNFNSDAFKLYSYNELQNGMYVDLLDSLSLSDFEKRRKMQEDIMGTSWESLKDWTVMVGDNLFMVPPTSIRLMTQMQNDKVPLMRSKGSMIKGAKKVQRLLELSLFFNEESINGIPYKTTLPNGKEITYYMNGLRSLVAQFKMCPFLPIESSYINEALGIEAVSLVNLQVSTIPDYPRCLQASLTLEEFDYRIYMPELAGPISGSEDSFTKNMFASCINYETMRWYYQRPIINGERIADCNFIDTEFHWSKDSNKESLDVTSPEYLEATFGGKTLLQPMVPGDSSIKFYVPDADYLDQQLKLKIDALSTPLRAKPDYSEAIKAFESNMGGSLTRLRSVEPNDIFENVLAKQEGYDLVAINQSMALKQTSSIPGSMSLGKVHLHKTDSSKSDAAHYLNWTKFSNTLNSATQELCKEVLKALHGQSVSIEEKVSEDGENGTTLIDFIVTVQLDKTMVAKDAEFSDYMNYIKSVLKTNNDILDDAGRIKLTYRSVWNKPESTKIDGVTVLEGKRISSFKLVDNDATAFLAMCGKDLSASDYESASDDTNSWETAKKQGLQDWMVGEKENIDIVSSKSLKFREYPIKGDVHIKNIAFGMSNTLSRITVQSSDSFAPQYLGGQDTTVEVSIETTSLEVVGMLQELPKLAAKYARDYRLILSAWPLRIDSQITRFLSINEVLIESVTVDTVPGYPGLYAISLKLLSLDRSIRNRESLRQLDIQYNNGANSTAMKGTRQMKDYFDMDEALKKVNVYPDLELPLIEELSLNGFKFIRYSNARNKRMYPDPDFYFVYSHVLSHELTKEMILNSYQQSKNENNALTPPKYELTDLLGNQVEISPLAKKAFSVETYNSSVKDMESYRKDFEKAFEDSLTAYQDSTMRNLEKSYSLEINTMMAANFNKLWDIGKEIKVHFRENQFTCKSIEDRTDNVAQNKLNANARNAIAFIERELHSNIKTAYINDIDKAETVYSCKSYSNQQAVIADKFKLIAKDFFDGVGSHVLQELGFNHAEWKHVEDKLKLMLRAAAAVHTSSKEYSSGAKCFNWGYEPKRFINPDAGYTSILNDAYLDKDGWAVPICIVKRPESESKFQATSYEEAYTYGKELGMFAIKEYENKNQMIQALGGDTELYNKYFRDAKRFIIDPYYATCPDWEYIKYKKAILMSPSAAGQAFVRIMLIYLEKLIRDGILCDALTLASEEVLKAVKDAESKNKQPNAPVAHGYGAVAPTVRSAVPEIDIPKDASKEKKEAMEKGKKAADEYVKARKSSLAATSKAIEGIIKDTKKPRALGMIFLPMLLALTRGDSYLYELIKQKNYDELNIVIANYSTAENIPFSNSDSKIAFYKFLNGLVGVDVIDKPSTIGQATTSPNQAIKNISNQCVYLDAQDDPSLYTLHSFYDMIMTDRRGRMVRAFPTFYMLFIDEGRDIGFWKLHDNFYTMSAISEINIVKSRKIAADTASITMSNMFKTYVNDDEDLRIGYNDYTIWDAYNSIFSPRTYYMKEEIKRRHVPPIDRAVVQTGIRLHVRIGYSADASELPVVFNGCITECGGGDVMQITAQGDGVELMNPLMIETDAEDVQHEDRFALIKMWKSWITHGATPKEILGSLLTARGGFMKKVIYDFTDGRFFNRNPYGLIHFGEPEFKEIFQDGEPLQNIYEGQGNPTTGNKEVSVTGANRDNLNNNGEDTMLHNGISSVYATEDAPLLSCHVFGKSYWDIMHICASACPDYITSVVPFGLRSSIFFGKPRFYYAYAYEKCIDEQGSEYIREKRKPFQQTHLYNSYHDIICDSILASEENVRTCAVGSYISHGWGTRESQKKTEPLWVSWDIYPEKQKTMTVDTQLLAKGTATGDIIPFMNWLQSELADDKGSFQGGHALAWRMTASALRNSVKDMYTGDLSVIGDPSVKPYDRIHINDIYERVQGACVAEAVIHTLSVETGFTTTINPDCIAVIDDRQEQITHHMMNSILGKTVAAQAAIMMTSSIFAGTTRPLLTQMLKYVDNATELGEKAAGGVANIIGKENFVKSSGWLGDKADSLNQFFGVDVKKERIGKTLEILKAGDGGFGGFGKVEDLGSLYSTLNKMMGEIDNNNPAKINELLNKGDFSKLKPEDIEKLEKARETLKNMPGQYTDDVAKALFNADDIKDVSSLLEELNKTKKTEKLEKAIKSLDKIKNGCNTVEDVKVYNDAIKTLASHHADIKKLDNAEDAAKNISKIIKRSEEVYKAVDDVSKVTRAGIKSKGLLASLEELSGLAFITTGTGLVGAAVSIGMEIAVTWAITAFVNEYVERYMKSLNVVQVFPLFKDGKPYTAGLQGSKGCVFGSPSYEDPGLIGGTLANLFQSKKPTAANDYSFNLIGEVLLTDTMKGCISRFKKKNGFPDDNASNTDFELINKQMLDMLNFQTVKMQSGYKAMMTLNRIKSLSNTEDKEAVVAFNRYKIADQEGFNRNPEVTQGMVCLHSAAKTKNMIEKGYLRLTHDSETVKKNGLAKEYMFKIENQEQKITCINDEANQLIDAPFLRIDSYYLLCEIIDALDKKFNRGNTNNKEKKENWFKDHFINVNSCLKVYAPKAKKSWFCTGFAFEISVTGFDGLDCIIDDIIKGHQKYMNALKKSDQLFCQKKKTSGGYMIIVHPPTNQ